MDTTELRELAEKLPAGPWGWFGGESSFYLATKHSGRLYLMAFERRGMNGAQPVFRTGHTITPAADLAQFEVGDKSVVGFKEARKDGSVYRYDVRGFDNDVARWIAACSPDVILSLLEDLERTRSSNEAMRKALIEIADHTRNCVHDGGFDREFGPVGCLLGDKCLCIGLHPIAVDALNGALALQTEGK